jgi:hypothetical protein
MTINLEIFHRLEWFQTQRFGNWTFLSSDVRDEKFLLSWTHRKELNPITGPVAQDDGQYPK